MDGRLATSSTHCITETHHGEDGIPFPALREEDTGFIDAKFLFSRIGGRGN